MTKKCLFRLKSGTLGKKHEINIFYKIEMQSFCVKKELDTKIKTKETKND